MRRLVMLSLVLCILLCFDVYAEYSWEQRVENSGEKVWYYTKSGPLRPHWISEAGYKYYVGADGRLCTEFFDGHVFNLKENSEIPYGALIEPNQVLAKEKKCDDFTYLEVKRENLVHYKKIIIMLHGLSGKKIDYRYHASEAADKNVLVLVPELYGHEGEAVADIGEMVKVTSEHIDEMLKYYNTGSTVEIDILGCSLGGIIGSYYTTHGEHKITKLGMLISSLNYEVLTHEIFQYKYKNGAEYEKISLSKLEECLTNISDNHNFKDTKIEMYNTMTDPYMPYNRIKVWAKNLVQHTMGYSGHTVTEQEFHDVIEWLVE